jgi:diaminopropionate ammonia-lyase
MTSMRSNMQAAPVRQYTNRSAVVPDNLTLPWWCDEDAHRAPQAYLAACAKVEPTPLRELDGLAGALGIARLAAKDETRRLGLGNFKALGGAYAVFRLAQRKASEALGREVAPEHLLDPEVKSAIGRITVCCATDGNHGRSVAAGARLLGFGCVVFLHSGVSKAREDAIGGFGASIVRVTGSYEDSVRHAFFTSETEGWTLIADTAKEDSPVAEMCGFVMQGYTVLLQEVLAVPGPKRAPFTHVFVQAGVGGLAAVVMGHWAATEPGRLPKFIVVEPDRSACLLESAVAGELVRIADDEATVMSMLECQRPSDLAWPIVSLLAHTFVAIGDDDARAARSRLLHGTGSDASISCGESGVAGLAALLRIREDAGLWRKLDLGPHSSVLVIITEAAEPEGAGH